MKIVISGSSGMVGSRLRERARAEGHVPLRLLRDKRGGDDSLYWDPSAGVLDASQLEGVDAIVNLAGENIADGRWSDERKRRLRESRIKSTELLAKTVAQLEKPPAVLLSASAIGYYGDRGSETLTEESAVGMGFLADLCKDWEGATRLASEAGVRTVLLRIGVVLSKDGGALTKMLPPFQMGAGGPLGSGDQYMSWITLDDLVDAILYLLKDDSISGPVNGTAPQPVTNSQFTKELASELHRPAFLPAPSFALKLLLGEMAEELLLASAKVEPAKLQRSNFEFKHPTLKEALPAVL